MGSEFGLDIQKFVNTIDTKKNPEFASHLKDSLQWLGKRQTYSHEYYRQLKRNTTPKKLEIALFMFDEDVRVRYEAANLAHLQNVHAACDAFPFALHVLLGGLSKPVKPGKQPKTNEHFKWLPELVGEVKAKYPEAHALHDALNAFLNDANFLILKALVNQAKHQYFPKLHLKHIMKTSKYNLSIPSFVYLTYPNGKATEVTRKGLDVLEFAKVIHNETLLKIFELYKLAYDCVK